jgi:hypothetical protein
MSLTKDKNIEKMILFKKALLEKKHLSPMQWSDLILGLGFDKKIDDILPLSYAFKNNGDSLLAIKNWKELIVNTDCNSRDDMGETPLMTALFYGVSLPGVVWDLLMEKSDLSIRNNNGDTILSLYFMSCVELQKRHVNKLCNLFDNFTDQEKKIIAIDYAEAVWFNDFNMLGIEQSVKILKYFTWSSSDEVTASANTFMANAEKMNSIVSGFKELNKKVKKSVVNERNFKI